MLENNDIEEISTENKYIIRSKNKRPRVFSFCLFVIVVYIISTHGPTQCPFQGKAYFQIAYRAKRLMIHLDLWRRQKQNDMLSR